MSDRYTGFAPCPCCFESSGYMGQIISATWTDPSYEDCDYSRRCPECEGTGMVEADEPRTLDDLESEEWDTGTAAWFEGVCCQVFPPDEDLEAMITRPAATVSGSVRLADAILPSVATRKRLRRTIEEARFAQIRAAASTNHTEGRTSSVGTGADEREDV